MLLFLFLVVFCVLPPVLTILILRSKGKITNWDLSNRSQRIRVFGVFLLFFLIDVVLLGVVSPQMTRIAVFFLLWFIGFFAATMFVDKLSGHVGTLTIILFLFIRWYGLGWAPFLLLLPVVAWSRIVLGRHTLRQVILGFGYSVLYLIFTYSIQLLP